jgi:molecular chaperone GrpE
MDEQRGVTEDERPGAADAAPGAAEPEIVDAEVVGEETAEGSAEEVGADLDALLADVKRERDEYLALAQRARADFENYRRRVSGETAEAERRGKASLAKGLLPALDNLERALSAAGIDPGQGADPGGEPPSEEVSARDALAAGVGLVYRELRGALERAGVRGDDPIGERFVPAAHEAIATGQAEGTEPGIVLETLEQGYRVDEQVIRPARVVVSG